MERIHWFGARSRAIALVGVLWLAGERAAAQGAGGMELSDRVWADCVYGRDAPAGSADSARTTGAEATVVILWRGAPDWRRRPPALVRPAPSPDLPDADGTAVGWVVASGRRYGAVDGGWRYRPGVLQLLGRTLRVDAPVVVLVDRTDGRGGPPVIVGLEPLRVRLPAVFSPRERPAGARSGAERFAADRRALLAELARSPRVRSFLR